MQDAPGDRPPGGVVRRGAGPRFPEDASTLAVAAGCPPHRGIASPGKGLDFAAGMPILHRLSKGLTTRFIERAGEVNTSTPAYVVGRVADAANDRRKPVKI